MFQAPPISMQLLKASYRLWRLWLSHKIGPWPFHHPIAQGNDHAIANAIRNLIENAISHSPANAEVTVSVLSAGAVSVVDQRPGISPEDREHIFQRFWRGRGAPAGGAGLGLAIVKEIVNAHGGRITIDVGAEGGSVFTLYFSLVENAAANSLLAFEECESALMVK
jgi:signal transduction histidine kinase